MFLWSLLYAESHSPQSARTPALSYRGPIGRDSQHGVVHIDTPRGGCPQRVPKGLVEGGGGQKIMAVYYETLIATLKTPHVPLPNLKLEPKTHGWKLWAATMHVGFAAHSQRVGHLLYSAVSRFCSVTDDSTIRWALVHPALAAPRKTLPADVIIDWSRAVSSSQSTPLPPSGLDDLVTCFLSAAATRTTYDPTSRRGAVEEAIIPGSWPSPFSWGAAVVATTLEHVGSPGASTDPSPSLCPLPLHPLARAPVRRFQVSLATLPPPPPSAPRTGVWVTTAADLSLVPPVDPYLGV